MKYILYSLDVYTGELDLGTNSLHWLYLDEICSKDFIDLSTARILLSFENAVQDEYIGSCTDEIQIITRATAQKHLASYKKSLRQAIIYDHN